MGTGINPYEPSAPSPSREVRAKSPSDLWKFFVLGIAVLSSLTSLVPIVAIVLIVLCCPVFLTRYDLWLRDRGRNDPSRVLVWLARVLGAIPLGLSIFAAAAAAFLGTCSVTGWSLTITGWAESTADRFSNDPMMFLFLALGAGSLVGGVVFLTVFLWLRARLG